MERAHGACRRSISGVYRVRNSVATRNAYSNCHTLTSNVAGGLWDPVTVYDRDRVTPEFRRQFGDAARFAFRRYQSMAGEWYGVRWLPVYSLSRTGPHQAPPSTSAYSEVEPLYPEAKGLVGRENPFDTPFAHRRQSMLIEPAI